MDYFQKYLKDRIDFFSVTTTSFGVVATSFSALHCGYNVINPNSSDIFLTLYDESTTVIYQVPANGSIVLEPSELPLNYFENGFKVTVSTSLALVTAPVSGVIVQLWFRRI